MRAEVLSADLPRKVGNRTRPLPVNIPSVKPPAALTIIWSTRQKIFLSHLKLICGQKRNGPENAKNLWQVFHVTYVIENTVT